MISRTTEQFRFLLAKLPESIRRQARSAYRLFQQNPRHPSLHFKSVHPNQPIYSVRISRDYRAVGIQDDERMVWFWIGPHSDYDQLLKRFRRSK